MPPLEGDKEEGKGLKILTSSKLLTRLLISLDQRCKQLMQTEIRNHTNTISFLSA